jgi:hypothetical protein
MKKKRKRKVRGKAKPVSDDVRYIVEYCLPTINAMRRIAPHSPEPQRKEILEAAECLEKMILGRLLIRCMHDGTLEAAARALGHKPFNERNTELTAKAYMNVAYSEPRRPTYKEIYFEVERITPRGEKPPSFKTVQRISEALFQIHRRAKRR